MKRTPPGTFGHCLFAVPERPLCSACRAALDRGWADMIAHNERMRALKRVPDLMVTPKEGEWHLADDMPPDYLPSS